MEVTNNEKALLKAKIEEWIAQTGNKFTLEEAKLIVNELEQKTEPQDFGFVYRDKDGHVSVDKTFLKEKKDIFWGIEVEGLKISKRRKYGTWYELTKQAEEDGERLLSIEEMKKLFRLREQFNSVFIKLRKFGYTSYNTVDTKTYWTSEFGKNNRNMAYAIDMRKPPRLMSSYVRLMLYGYTTLN